MKSAKEMFEKLGYKKIETFDMFTDEIMPWNYKYIKYDGNRYTEIHINNSTKLIFINDQFISEIANRNNVTILTVEELQAINKQVEELGWLEREVN